MNFNKDYVSELSEDLNQIYSHLGVEAFQNQQEEALKIIDNFNKKIKQFKKQLKEKSVRISELQDKDWYEGIIKQLEEQNGKLIKERDLLKQEVNKWRDGTIICKLCDVENNIKELKSKLVDKDKMIEELKFANKNLDHTLRVAPNASEGQHKRIVELKEINHKLKQELKLKDKEIEKSDEEWREICDGKLETINRLIEENYQLKQQLTNKESEHELLINQFEEETNKLRKQIKSESDARKQFAKEHQILKQSQNQKIIEELEKMRKELDCDDNCYYGNNGIVIRINEQIFNDFIDQRIKELRGDNNE